MTATLHSLSDHRINKASEYLHEARVLHWMLIMGAFQGSEAEKLREARQVKLDQFVRLVRVRG